jgi:membrane protein
MTFKRLFRLLKASFQEWQNDKASRLAAALAYYTVFSLSPLLILAIAIAGAIFGEQAARGEIVGQIQGLLGQEGAQAVQTAIENANQPNVSSIASIISIIVLLFGASGVFVQLQDALNTIWNVKVNPEAGFGNLIRKRLLSFSMILVIGFLLLVSLIISAALSGISHYLNDMIPGLDLLWQLLNIVISFVVITLLFAFIYKYLPDVEIQWRDVWIGAAITALLFTLGKWILGVYLGQSSFGSTYGAAGSLVVLLAWVYYSAQILFFGAEFTQVYARRYGSQIVPDRHAVRTSE